MIKRTIRVILVLGMIVCAITPSALAMSHAEQDSLISRDISEVEVVALRRREIIAPQRLSGERLKHLSSYSVADAVRYFAGVQIKDYGGVGGLKTIDVRSMGSHHLGVFYDGLQIGNAQNGIVDLGKFSIENMEEVTLFNGQKSELLQPAKDYGTSSSVYLTTRHPSFKENNRFNISATTKCGSFGLVNGSVLYEQKITDKIALVANAEMTHATGKYTFRYHKVLEDLNGNKITAWDTTGTRQNGDIRSLRIEGGMYGTMMDGKWHLKAYFYDSERGLPRAIIRNVWTSSQRQWDKNVFVQGNMRKTLCSLSDLLVSAKYSYDYMRYFNPDTTLLYVDNTFTQQAFYSSVANVWHVTPILDFNVSADYERNWMTSDMANFAFPKRNMVLIAMAAALKTGSVSLQISALENLINDRSTRYTSQVGNFNQWRKRLTPSAFLNYQMPCSESQINIHAFFKRMFRMPTFNDLYYTDMGNVSLRPEYASQLDLGIGFATQISNVTCQLSADIYHNEVTDKIVAVPKGNSQYRWMMMNIGKVDVNGMDVKISFENNESSFVNYQLSVSYTLQEALDMTDPSDRGPHGTYRGHISYIPKHSGSAIAAISCKGWHLNYSFIYVGERYHVSANIPENYEPAWYTHDMNIGREFKLSDKLTINLSGEVNNVFDQQYDVVLNYPMPGRNYKGIIRIQI